MIDFLEETGSRCFFRIVVHNEARKRTQAALGHGLCMARARHWGHSSCTVNYVLAARAALLSLKHANTASKHPTAFRALFTLHSWQGV